MLRSFGFFRFAIGLSLCLVAIAQPHAAAAQDPAGSVRLLKAVTDRDGAAVIALLNTGSEGLINTPSRDNGETALHIVTRRGDATWVRFLIGKGATPDVLDNAGNSPLMIAIFNDDSEIASVLLDEGAKADFINARGETALIRAVQLRKPALVRLLIAHGANPDLADYVAGLSARDYATRDARSTALLNALTRRDVKSEDSLSSDSIRKPQD